MEELHHGVEQLANYANEIGYDVVVIPDTAGLDQSNSSLGQSQQNLLPGGA